MSAPSMLMTIGTLLDRAKDAGAPVTLTFNGSTYGVSGIVVARDEQGVALVVDVDYIVVRLADVTSVRVVSRAVEDQVPVPEPRNVRFGGAA